MNKVFLSHSSADKDVVHPVFEDLGAAIAHYDERTFEPDSTSAEEILEALSSSEVFVFFLSHAAISSEWVKKELQYANHFFFEGKIKKILVFPLKGADRSLLPVWLRPFVVQQANAVAFISTRIRTAIINLEVQSRTSSDIFIGREKDSEIIKNDLIRVQGPRPTSIVLSGVDGIGRRKLLQKTLADIFSFLPKIFVEVELLKFEGEIDFYARAHLKIAGMAGSAASKNLISSEDFVHLGKAEKTAAILALLAMVADDKQLLVVKGSAEILNEDGYISPWLQSVLEGIESPFPVIAVIANRKPRLKPGSQEKTIYYHVSSISRESSKSLFTLVAFPDALPPADLNVDHVIDMAEGHPGLIHMAANALRNRSINTSEAPRLVSSSVSEKAASIISSLSLSDVDKMIISLVDELGALSVDDITIVSRGLSDKDGSEAALRKLQEYGAVEEWAGAYRVAPFLQRPMSAFRDEPIVVDFLREARKALIQSIENHESLDGDNVITMSSAILASIRETGDFKNALVSRPLIASRLLQVARRLYDEQDFSRSLNIAKKAYDVRIALTEDARIETLRVIGLSAARSNDEDSLNEAIQELRKANTTKTKRIATFAEGFWNRLNGRFDPAYRLFSDCINLDGNGDYHVLRELASLCLFNENLVDAEKYARRAIKVAPANAYTIDILAQTLIEKFRLDPTVSYLLDEIDTIMSSLKRNQSSRDRFYATNEIRLRIAKRDFGGLEEMISSHEKSRKVSGSQANLLKAQVYYATGKFKSAEAEIKRLDNYLAQFSKKDHQTRVIGKALSVNVHIASQDFSKARLEMEDLKVRLPQEKLKILEKSLAEGIARAKYDVGAELKAWARSRL